MNILDSIIDAIANSEVLNLREEASRQKARIEELEKTVLEQIEQIGNANQRVSRTTNANLELKRKLREHGIDCDGMAA